MVIDISDILIEVGLSKDFEGDVTIGDIMYQRENIHFDKPLHVKGIVTNGGELIMLNAHFSGSAKMRCGACADLYSHSLEHDIEITLKPSPDKEDPDIYVYTNNLICLDDIIIREFLLRLPVNRRCSEDCKGLCPICGTNLNFDDCHCIDGYDEPIDSRLSKLKDFFAKENEEV